MQPKAENRTKKDELKSWVDFRHRGNNSIVQPFLDKSLSPILYHCLFLDREVLLVELQQVLIVHDLCGR